MFGQDGEGLEVVDGNGDRRARAIPGVGGRGERGGGREGGGIAAGGVERGG